LPLIIVLMVVGKGVALVAVSPPRSLRTSAQQIGGTPSPLPALALVLLACYGAGLWRARPLSKLR
jgi:hypothetical protein